MPKIKKIGMGYYGIGKWLQDENGTCYFVKIQTSIPVANQEITITESIGEDTEYDYYKGAMKESLKQRNFLV